MPAQQKTPLRFSLPAQVGAIAHATKELRACYPDSGLAFTPDGKFVGDLGEAIAVEMFGIRLQQGEGVDGYFGDTPVQIKATGRAKGGAVFRDPKVTHPEDVHLIAYFLDWEAGVGELLYNGLESSVRPDCKGGQREVSRHKLLSESSGSGPSAGLPIRDEFRKRYVT